MERAFTAKFIGLDVHSKTISVAIADEGRKGEVRHYGTIENTFEAIDKVIKKLTATTDKVGYELFGQKAYFDGDWKILFMPKPFGTGDWELFNLKNDPGELNDLSKQYPDKRKDMVALWEQYKLDNECSIFHMTCPVKIDGTFYKVLNDKKVV